MGTATLSSFTKYRILYGPIKAFYPGTIVRARKLSTTTTLKNNSKELQSWKEDLHKTMKILPDFINQQEEEALMKEIEPYFKRMRYEYNHWDNAIHGFRERENRQWNKENTEILNRVREKAFPVGTPQIAHIHMLDLSEDGWIKPHVDSIRFCGEIIAGLSLLSNSVMRLTMVGNEKECLDDFLLPRRSLYIMSGEARYKYNHEILKTEDSYFQGKHVPKTRRVSVICRCEPDPKDQE